jgi:hypothetical protein
MTFWNFAADSPFLTFFAIYMITVTIYRSVVWVCRCLNIRKHGWPPPHCDADGDPRDPADDPSSPTEPD